MRLIRGRYLRMGEFNQAGEVLRWRKHSSDEILTELRVDTAGGVERQVRDLSRGLLVEGGGYFKQGRLLQIGETTWGEGRCFRMEFMTGMLLEDVALT